MMNGVKAKQFKSGHWRTLAVSIFLLIDIAVCTTWIVLVLQQISLLQSQSNGQYISPGEWEASRARIHAFRVVASPVRIATILCFLLWIYRANRNLLAFGLRGLRYGWAWAVGGFFVPFLNLVRPYQVVSEIWRASSPTAGELDGSQWIVEPEPPPVISWWAACLMMGFVGLIGELLSDQATKADAALIMSWCDVASFIVTIIASALALIVVSKIDGRQEEKGSRMQEVLESQTRVPEESPKVS